MRRGGWTDGEEDSLDSARRLESFNDSLDFLDIRNTIPEQASASSSEATVGSLKVPGSVLVIGLGCPEESSVILLDRIKDVVDNLVENTVLGWEELGHDRGLSLRVRDDGHDVEWFITVDGVWGGLEGGEDLGDRSLARDDFGVSLGKDLSELSGANGVYRVLLVELVSPLDQCSCTSVGEELLLEHVCGDDSDRGCSGKSVEKFLDFPNLELGTKLNPRLFHEGIVFFVEVDGGNLLSSDTVEETTLFVKVDNLHGLILASYSSARWKYL